MNLHEVLLTKARQQKLAHFYIVECNILEEEAFTHLISFASDFIRDYYQKIENQKQVFTGLLNHPDVFVMGNLPTTEEPETKPFQVEESGQLNRFFEFKPVQGKKKFAVITEGHRIPAVVANKWLKLFEEPHGDTTIFLLNPRGQKLLPTIHSRALHLRLFSKFTPAVSTEWQDFIAKAQKEPLASFLEQNVKAEKDLVYWTQELVRWEAEQLEHPLKKDALVHWIKKLQEMETFHQPSATKWSLFYSFLHQHILSRATH